MSKSSNRPHYVDESTETVYISVESVSESLPAPEWVRKNFPGYKCSIVKPEDLRKKFKGDTENDA